MPTRAAGPGGDAPVQFRAGLRNKEYRAMTGLVIASLLLVASDVAHESSGRELDAPTKPGFIVVVSVRVRGRAYWPGG